MRASLICRTTIYQTRLSRGAGRESRETSPYAQYTALWGRLFHHVVVWVLVPRTLFVLVVAICLLPGGALARPGMEVNENLSNYTYLEDFELNDPFLPWVSNGSYVVHYKGLTDERSLSGRRSFKLDITLGTAKYVYFRIPVDVPVADSLAFKADVYISKNDGVGVAVGTQILYRPSPFDGYLNDKYIQQIGSWEQVSFNLATEAERIGEGVLKQYAGGASPRDVVPWVNQIGIFLFSETGGRATLYIDDIQIKGKLPTKKSQLELANARWNGYLEKIGKVVPVMIAQVKSDSKVLSIQQNMEYGEKARKNAQDVAKSIEQPGFPDGMAYLRLKKDVEQLRILKQHESIEGVCRPQLSLHPRKAISNTWPDPADYPLPDPPGEQLIVRATPGEYEPVAFTLHAFEKLSGVRVAVGAIHGSGNLISPDAFDVRLVKYWYQAGKGSISRQWKYRYLSQSFLVPELLVHDDGLVKVDTDRKVNYLRAAGLSGRSYVDISSNVSAMPKGARISDALTLQPFSVDKGENKQVWITVHVPKDQKPGIYSGPVNVSVNGKKCGSLNLRLEVLPFSLEDPSIEYAIYYRGKINDQATAITSEEKSRLQYRKELENIRSHGIQAATVYDEDSRAISEALELRKVLGFRTDKAWLLANGTGTPKTDEELKALIARAAKQVSEVSRAGYATTYLYAKEESHGAEVLQLREALKAAHRGGAKVFTAVYEDAVNYVGDLLDMANIAKVVDKKLADQWHAHGKLIFSYSNPQAGVEEPNTYRRNYGLSLWCAGYDGAMLYAYQDQFGPNIWNDFDDKTYRDHVFAYPTSDGVVDTIEWEGLREGIDDVRYATTLLKIAGGEKGRIQKTLCEKVATLGDLDSVRAWMIQQIEVRKR